MCMRKPLCESTVYVLNRMHDASLIHLEQLMIPSLPATAGNFNRKLSAYKGFPQGDGWIIIVCCMIYGFAWIGRPFLIFFR